MNWLAMDIGGANLKVADGKGFAHSRPFALWKDSPELAQELRTLIAESPPSDRLIVTMTGELADCFDSKAEGVRFILQAVEEASDRRHTRVYLTNGMLVTPQIAIRRPLEVAAANWHALARFAGRYAEQGPALLIDIGTTSCDIVPLLDGQPVAVGLTDTDRLLSGELVYTGVSRSPVCALVLEVPYRRRSCPVAQELFATTCDVYVILGDLPEDPTYTHTADGRGATKSAARRRLGRVICADAEQFNHRDAVAIAQAVSKAQVAQVRAAAERVIDRQAVPPATVILSGLGEFVARRVAEGLASQPRIVALSRQLNSPVSRCATAHALAVVARETVGG